MSTNLPPEAQRLTDSGRALREQLRRLDTPAAGQPLPLAEVLAALDDYESAALACVPPVPAWQLTPDPTPPELLAEREADPVYRLGWVRGYQQGQAAGQRQADPALRLYAQHGRLPAPPDPTALVQQVRRYLSQLHERYGTGPLSHFLPRPAA